MASITKVSTGWRARYRTPEGRSRGKTFPRKVDAERFLTGVEHQKLSGGYADQQLGRRALSDYSTGWLATKVDLRPRTRINVEGRLRNHILPVFGGRAMASIRPEDVRVWIADLSETKGLAPATVKAAYLVLSQIMATAELDGVIGRTPCNGVRLPRDGGGAEMLFLTPGQVGVLADELDPRFGALILTAAYAGLRAGELGALKVSRVNFLKARLSVVEAVSEVRGALVVGPTKTGASRDVPLPRFLVDVLAEHVASYPSVDGLVFTMPEGGPLRHRNFYRRHYQPAVVCAGLPRGLRFHDLRHTAAAILIDRGASPKQMQTMLGHSTVRLTLDRYGHLFEGHADALMDALDDVYADSRVSRSCHDGVTALPRNAAEAR